jgi:hypothetical protein
LVEWSLDGPLPKMCPVIPTSNQDGRQAKNRKKVLKFRNFDEKREITPKWVMGFTSKLQGK